MALYPKVLVYSPEGTHAQYSFYTGFESQLAKRQSLQVSGGFPRSFIGQRQYNKRLPLHLPSYYPIRD